MIKKEAFAVLFLSIAVLLIAISGCGKDQPSCADNQSMINGTCCYDTNENSICDLNETNHVKREDIPPICGNQICENLTEDCTNCWKDCGACKKVVYVYIPRNFSLAELQEDINDMTGDDLKFRKDINNLNNVSNFFYYDKTLSRYFGEFMDVTYKFQHPSRYILLNQILLDSYYLNESADLFRFVNFSDWYITNTIRNRELQDYDSRIVTNKAKDDYPTQRTGYQKVFRYSEWDFRNYTSKESVIADNVSLLDNGMVESVFASITNYNITYKSSEYVDKDPDTPTLILEDFTKVVELRLGYTHTLTFRCARNLAITLYNYDYEQDYYGEYYKITEDNVKLQIPKNRAELIRRASALKAVCDKKYSKEVFVYT